MKKITISILILVSLLFCSCSFSKVQYLIKDAYIENVQIYSDCSIISIFTLQDGMSYALKDTVEMGEYMNDLVDSYVTVKLQEIYHKHCQS